MIITLDIECSGLDPYTDKIHLIGYRIDGKGDVIYVDPNSKDGFLDMALSGPGNTLRGHNIRFDAHFLRLAGYSIKCQLEDTRVGAYLAWPSEESHSLKHLVRSKLNTQPTELSDILFKPLVKELKGLDDATIDQYYYRVDERLVRKDTLKEYHKEDVLNVDRLRQKMSLPQWFFDVEMPLTKLIFEIESYGCPLDREFLSNLGSELEYKVFTLYESLGGSEEFNPNSSQQIAERLKTDGVDIEKECGKTKTGLFQVDKSYLKTLVWRGNTFAKDLLEYKRLSKILGTYVQPFLQGSLSDGRLHGSFNQAGSEDLYGEGRKGTNTGRLSSANPNLQNIPARTEEGKKVRKAFIASKEHLLYNTDLKQIEPRLIAHYSQSPKLLNAYANNLDTHGMFACDIFNVPDITNLSTTQRFIGKTSWLATTYGCSYKKLVFICKNFSETPLDIDLSEHIERFDGLPTTCFKKPRGREYCWSGCKACLIKEFQTEKKATVAYAEWMFFKEVQDNFKAKNPEIMGWREGQIAKTKRLGYVETIGGRRIEIPDINAPNKALASMAERKAVNSPIQGSCADIFKLATLEGQKLLDKKEGRFLTFVHDEWLFESKQPVVKQEWLDVCSKAVKLRNVAIDCDFKQINNWSEK